jgi:hypothetical protein
MTDSNDFECSRYLLEQLIVAESLKKFPAFLEHRFITVSIIPRRWCMS